MSAVKSQAFRSPGAWEQWLRKREAQKEKRDGKMGDTVKPPAGSEGLDSLRTQV